MVMKRRNNLYGINFDSLVELGSPYITDIKMSKNIDGESVLDPVGYNADLMQYLMSTLNFTLQHTLVKVRNEYNFMVNEISHGNYDIGLLAFNQDRRRKDLVDFSFAFESFSTSLYYIKSYKTLNFNVFMKSFQNE